MLLHLSDLGPSSNNDPDKIGYISMKKHQHPRTEEDGGDDQDNTELAKKKKAKKNLETEVDSSSSDHSCFVALVTASNLHKDALCLPQDSTSSNGFQRKCRKIVLTDGGERAWALDMKFNKSSNTFYINRGWRSFCDENSKKAGDVFVFKLAGNGETPLLSFCPAESRGEVASKKKTRPVEVSSGKNISKEKRKKNHLRCTSLTSPSQNRFVTLTLTSDSLKNFRLWLPLSFTIQNGMYKPGMITLLGKDGSKWQANLRCERRRHMLLGKGWKEFARGNGLKTGESFTLESVWENGVPMLSLLSTESTSDRRHIGECSKDTEKESFSTERSSENKTREAKNNREERRDSSSAFLNRFVTLTLTPEDVRDCKLILPSQFMKTNGINKLGRIILLGRDNMKCSAYLLSRDGFMALEIDWKGFCEANGVKTGESFTLECSFEQDTALVFKFCSNSRE